MSVHLNAEKVIRDLIWIGPDRIKGEPRIYGTRIPIRLIWDYIGGEGLEEFFIGFPQVPRKRVIGILELGRESLINQIQAA
jgi:uncharacterized protein (DUF433 family)